MPQQVNIFFTFCQAPVYVVLVCVSCLLSFKVTSVEAEIEAEKFYRTGLDASHFEEANQAFNRSLSAYLHLFNSLPFPSSSIYQAIGNNYFQLNELSLAILYYEKAKKLTSDQAELQELIDEAKSLLKITSNSHSFSFALPLQFQNWAIFFLMSLLIGVFLLHSKYKFVKILCIFFSAFSFLLLFNIMISFYFNLIEGIVVTSTGCYQKFNHQYSLLTFPPKKAGEKVFILSIHAKGKWLKVKDMEGNLCYLPSSSIRLI